VRPTLQPEKSLISYHQRGLLHRAKISLCWRAAAINCYPATKGGDLRLERIRWGRVPAFSQCPPRPNPNGRTSCPTPRPRPRSTLPLMRPRRAVEKLPSVPTTIYRTISVDGPKVFYREAGNPKAPAVLLLHGFPTSSHMYRELIPALANRYHVVAPDLPGFGFTEAPDRKTFNTALIIWLRS
jgi:alpha/beta hydrolase family protein